MSEAAASATVLDGQVLIIGAGLIGGSIGLGLSAARGDEGANGDVIVRDASPGTARLAEELGVGRVQPERAAETGLGQGLDPQLVVVATPPDVAAPVILGALEEFPRATVVDVASVKEPIARQVLAEGAERGIDTSRYVGTHPMAGRETSGVVGARSDLFRGRPFVIVPHAHSAPASVRLARNLGIDLGAVVVDVDAATHDEAVAYVSHVPQLVASLLASRLPQASDEALSLSGQGLRDTTRIAASDPRLWVEILSANAGAILPVLHGLREDLGAVVDAFDRLVTPDAAPGSRAVIARAIARGNDGVRRIPGKHGSGPDAFVTITVLVPDTPGALARLLTDMGEEGINLEDLRLEHSLGQPVGLAHVSVGRADESAVLGMLEARGWARASEE